MKILQVVNFFSPHHGGGSIEVVYQLSKALAQRGHEVSIYTSDIELDQQYISSLSEVKSHAFHKWLTAANLQFTPGIINASKKELEKFDVIHMHNYRTFQNIVVHHYAKKYSVPYVLQAHGSAGTYFTRGNLKKVYDILGGYNILRNANKLIAVSPGEVEQYEKLGIAREKIEIIPNGINPNEFDNLPPRGEFREQYNLSDNEKLILYLGRIHQVKGIDLLVKSFINLPENLGKVRLVIAGPDDGYLSSLKKLSNDLNLNEKIIFTGPLYKERKFEAYVAADVYVLPSVYEIFGITVLEACACGTPVIVTDRCGAANIVDGVAGNVVSYDSNELANAILFMLSDDKISREFSKNGRALVRDKFNWSRIAEQIENIYVSVCK